MVTEIAKTQDCTRLYYGLFSSCRFFVGNLNTNSNGTGILYSYTPRGEVESIINYSKAYESYQNNVPYSPLPGEGEGNSNSLIGSTLRAAGSDFQPSKWAPGWERNVLPEQKGGCLGK